MNWYFVVLKKYADFSGRARRKEYWMFFLVNLLFYVLTIVADNALGITIDKKPADFFGEGPIYYVYCLAMVLPSIAVLIRRLHDIGKSGWYSLLMFIPFLGSIYLFVQTCYDSTPGDNKYGANPKEAI